MSSREIQIIPTSGSTGARAAIARQDEAPEAEHPVVITHPGTGRKALFIGSATRHFVGMTVEESRPILDWLLGHATRYDFTYRHAW